MTHARLYTPEIFQEHVKIDPSSPSGLSWRYYNGRQITSKGKDGYYRFQLHQKSWKAHRVVWCLHSGPLDPRDVIDHIDRNKANNNISNLRKVSYKENRLNRVSGKGKYARKKGKRWESHFTMPGTRQYIHCGSFDTELEAHIEALARRLELYWVT